VVVARPFRFGVQLSTAGSADELVASARRIEELGYDSASIPDHFGDQLAPVPALMAILDATTTLRAGGLVFDNDYKHPVVLAKELATIDVLSGGRVDVGVGAGWMRTDYDQSGIPYDPPGMRVDRFAEAITVLKGCFADGAFSFDGAHYTITDYDGLPAPVQAPHPPLLIGGGGRRVLSIAAREADIVGINGTLTAGTVGPEAVATMTAEAVDEKVAIVRAAAGDRWSDIELHIASFALSVSDDRDGELERIAELVGVPSSMVAESPFALVGTPDQIATDLVQRRDRWGFSFVSVHAEDVEPFAPVVAALAGT
jgi:probable F420-dependent oxidoreductase